MLQTALGQYITVTASYWAFTLTDGALRMLVVLFFHQLGYSPLEVAMLFLLYEFFGVVTNLLGGWLAARAGLNMTMQIGLLLQIIALAMLLVDPSLLSVSYVMVAQALSGIAKDLNKMSAKSSIKMLVSGDQQGKLYHWVAVLTGSKNTMKGIGFFLGGLLLAWLGFRGAIVSMAAMLTIIFLASCFLLQNQLGKTAYKPKFNDIFSKSRPVNHLSAARFFLFGARDVWFVVALPVFLQMQQGWSHVQVGTMMAAWVIVYGFVQGLTPKITRRASKPMPDGQTVFCWALALSVIPLLIIALMQTSLPVSYSVVSGLMIFGAVFAINSSVHSYLIVAYAKEDGVSLDVGFYYMANAAGRLIGTILSGWVFQQAGFGACLAVSSAMLTASFMIARQLPVHKNRRVLA
jgi:predicted MFS family arabinose efflux permease